MKKNHAEEVNGQIANSLLTGELGAPPISGPQQDHSGKYDKRLRRTKGAR